MYLEEREKCGEGKREESWRSDDDVESLMKHRDSESRRGGGMSANTSSYVKRGSSSLTSLAYVVGTWLYYCYRALATRQPRSHLSGHLSPPPSTAQCISSAEGRELLLWWCCCSANPARLCEVALLTVRHYHVPTPTAPKLHTRSCPKHAPLGPGHWQFELGWHIGCRAEARGDPSMLAGGSCSPTDWAKELQRLVRWHWRARPHVSSRRRRQLSRQASVD